MVNLDEQSRTELLQEARRHGIERPERMTRVELRDAIVQRTVPKSKQAEARGLFGVARSMLASVVETGLHLPDAAKLIRGEHSYGVPASNQAPVATVTLAEIYAAQGHKSRALNVLEDVLRDEPDHSEALRVRSELLGTGASVAPESPAPGGVPRGGQTLPVSTKGAPVSIPPFGETTDYVPGGFVETTGEAIESEEPPAVVEVVPAEVPEGTVSAEVPEGTVSAEVFDRVELPEMPRPFEKVESIAITRGVGENEPPEVLDSAAESTITKSGNVGGQEATEAEPDAIPEGIQVALVLIQGAHDVLLYWELPRAALDRCGVDTSEGEAALRVVAFVPARSTPERVERAIPLSSGKKVLGIDGVDGGAGWIRLSDLPRGAAIRAAVGWDLGDAFLPLAVARSLEECRGDRSASALVERIREAVS